MSKILNNARVVQDKNDINNYLSTYNVQQLYLYDEHNENINKFNTKNIEHTGENNVCVT